MNDPRDSSVLVSALRRLAAGSVLCAAVVALARWHGRIQDRIGVGLGGAWTPEHERRRTEDLAALVAGSRVLAALSSVMSAPLTALPAAASLRLFAPVLRRDLETRVRVVGWVLVIAVFTQAVLLVAFGLPGQAIGWGFRIGVAAVGVFALWRPASIAAAIRDRTANE